MFCSHRGRLEHLPSVRKCCEKAVYLQCSVLCVLCRDWQSNVERINIKSYSIFQQHGICCTHMLHFTLQRTYIINICKFSLFSHHMVVLRFLKLIWWLVSLDGTDIAKCVKYYCTLRHFMADNNTINLYCNVEL